MYWLEDFRDWLDEHAIHNILIGVACLVVFFILGGIGAGMENVIPALMIGAVLVGAGGAIFILLGLVGLVIRAILFIIDLF